MFKKGSYLYYALANGMFYFSWGIFSCIISVYLAGVGCSATEISLITSSGPLFAIFSQPVCGMIADKVKSPKLVAIICLVLCAVFGMLFALSKNFIFLFLFNGITIGLLNGINPLSDRLATGAPYSFGTIRVWGSILYAIACQIAGVVYDYISPIANFYIFALSIGITLVAYYHLIDVKPRENVKTESFSLKELFSALFKNKPFVLFMLIYILFQGPTNANGIYMPLLIVDLGGTTSMVGTTLLLSTLFEIPAVLLSDKIMKTFSYKQLMIFAGVLSVIRFVWYATLPDPKMIMYVFFFQGLTSIIFILVAVRIVIDIVDERFVNSAYGISSMLAKGLSALLFQMISGTIVDSVGGNSAYTLVYLIYGVAILLSVVMACFFKMPKYKLREK